jgi:hypothetical protein
MRCFRCQRFGNTHQQCASSLLCGGAVRMGIVRLRVPIHPPVLTVPEAMHPAIDRVPCIWPISLSRKAGSRTVSLFMKQGKSSWNQGQKPGTNTMPRLFASHEVSMLHPRLQTPRPPGIPYTQNPAPRYYLHSTSTQTEVAREWKNTLQTHSHPTIPAASPLKLNRCPVPGLVQIHGKSSPNP